ncbi:response regulator transcription factor [Craterilacuibacter sinensis]|uniref:Response regulator n=1 Tax=Craterilacuibacter sinensis TaxID=2686017 RepID=A0A845BLF3_9NEIS|nr:response regulator [Craterilacuibacter sinensis]MXR36220.1 response regulator [Craterilacuibacter sinensis]
MSAKELAIVDDDKAVRDALLWLLDGQPFAVSPFESAEALLQSGDPARFHCLIVDLRLGGMSGLVLLERLALAPYCPPVIMLTAHGDVPHAVAALKLGAVDFLEKPFNDEHLMALLQQCLVRDETQRKHYYGKLHIEATLASLTEREREVMKLVLMGKLNKQIADDLAISMKTVEVHRARVFDKMGVKSAVELASRLAERQV